MKSLALFLSRHPALYFAILLLYVFSPFDIVPEALTGVVGFIDDILLVAAGILLRRYGQRLNSIDTEIEK